MKKRLLNLLIKYTKCSVSINAGMISLEWIWHGNSLKWDSLVPDGMLITLRDANMKAMGVYLPANKIALNECESKESAQIFKEVRDKAAYDPDYQRMRRSWRENE